MMKFFARLMNACGILIRACSRPCVGKCNFLSTEKQT